MYKPGSILAPRSDALPASGGRLRQGEQDHQDRHPEPPVGLHVGLRQRHQERHPAGRGAAVRAPEQDGLQGRAGPLRRPGQPGHRRGQRQGHRLRPRRAGHRGPLQFRRAAPLLRGIPRRQPLQRLPRQHQPQGHRPRLRAKSTASAAATTCRARWAPSSSRPRASRPPTCSRTRPPTARASPSSSRRRPSTLGIKVVGFAGTEEKANFDAILSPILAAKPECIYFGGMFDQAAVLFKQARQKGYKGMCLSDDGFDSADAARIGGEALLPGRRHLLLHRVRPGRRLSRHRQVRRRLQGQVRQRPPALRRPVLRLRRPPAQGHRERRPRRRGQDARPGGGRQGRARPEGLPRHHRHPDLQRQGRPGEEQVLHHPGHSADPAKWAANRIDQTLDIAPPQ